jgi:hypothetical protein
MADSSLDLKVDFDKIQKKIRATEDYKEAKQDYNKLKKKKGDSFEKKKEDTVKFLENKKKDSLGLLNQAETFVTGRTKQIKSEVKSQYNQLLDLFKITGGKNNDRNSVKYLKRILLTTVKNIEPKIKELLFEESLKTLNCDQEQTYTPNRELYVSVASVDLFQTFKEDIDDPAVSLFYEPLKNITPQQYPYSMNRQLYNRIQQNNSFNNLHLKKV